MLLSLEASQEPRITAAFSDVGVLRNSVALFARERHRLPTEAEGLDVLATGQDKLLDRVPRDPWGHPYIYRLTSDGADFEIHSSGHDGIDEHGAGDDVTTASKSYRCMGYYNDCPFEGRWWLSWLPFVLFLGSFAWLCIRAIAGLMWLARRLRRKPSVLVRQRPDDASL